MSRRVRRRAAQIGASDSSGSERKATGCKTAALLNVRLYAVDGFTYYVAKLDEVNSCKMPDIWKSIARKGDQAVTIAYLANVEALEITELRDLEMDAMTDNVMAVLCVLLAKAASNEGCGSGRGGADRGRRDGSV